MRTFEVETTHGRVAVAESRADGPAVLLIHGNSSCKEVFAKQFDSEIGKSHRLIAFDLPGHGASADAADPAQTYCLGGYAEVAVELLGKLGVESAKVLGWSLGGHIGLEMISRFPGLKSLMITGTPPVRMTPEGIGAGFAPSPVMGLTGKDSFTREEALEYARYTLGVDLPVDPHLLAACARTDGRARKFMFESLGAGQALDEVDIVADSRVPIAIFNGAAEPFVNLAYLNSLKYSNLWEGVMFVAPGMGHACFWEAPQIFNPVFARFLKDKAG
jgi:pimeloyl-ACP methyl ester carboxylesterase